MLSFRNGYQATARRSFDLDGCACNDKSYHQSIIASRVYEQKGSMSADHTKL